MNSILSASSFFGLMITIAAYLLGRKLQQRFRRWYCNPMILSIAMIIIFLLVFRIDYDTYNRSAKYLSDLLTPATVCFAIPLYRQLQRLKDHAAAILCGTAAGAVTGLACVLGLSVLFRLDHASYVTLLPKSITTAMAIGISGELGGYPAITVIVIAITGTLGNVAAPAALKLFRITDPVAKGIAIGSASHAMGTARAMELGETEGAMSSLAIVLCGLITVVGASFFAMWY